MAEKRTEPDEEPVSSSVDGPSRLRGICIFFKEDGGGVGVIRHLPTGINIVFYSDDLVMQEPDEPPVLLPKEWVDFEVDSETGHAVRITKPAGLPIHHEPEEIPKPRSHSSRSGIKSGTAANSEERTLELTSSSEESDTSPSKDILTGKPKRQHILIEEEVDDDWIHVHIVPRISRIVRQRLGGRKTKMIPEVPGSEKLPVAQPKKGQKTPAARSRKLQQRESSQPQSSQIEPQPSTTVSAFHDKLTKSVAASRLMSHRESPIPRSDLLEPEPSGVDYTDTPCQKVPQERTEPIRVEVSVDRQTDDTQKMQVFLRRLGLVSTQSVESAREPPEKLMPSNPVQKGPNTSDKSEIAFEKGQSGRRVESSKEKRGKPGVLDHGRPVKGPRAMRRSPRSPQRLRTPPINCEDEHTSRGNIAHPSPSQEAVSQPVGLESSQSVESAREPPDKLMPPNPVQKGSKTSDKSEIAFEKGQSGRRVEKRGKPGVPDHGRPVKSPRAMRRRPRSPQRLRTPPINCEDEHTSRGNIAHPSPSPEAVSQPAASHSGVNAPVRRPNLVVPSPDDSTRLSPVDIHRISSGDAHTLSAPASETSLPKAAPTGTSSLNPNAPLFSPTTPTISPQSPSQFTAHVAAQDSLPRTTSVHFFRGDSENLIPSFSSKRNHPLDFAHGGISILADAQYPPYPKQTRPRTSGLERSGANRNEGQYGSLSHSVWYVPTRTSQNTIPSQTHVSSARIKASPAVRSAAALHLPDHLEHEERSVHNINLLMNRRDQIQSQQMYIGNVHGRPIVANTNEMASLADTLVTMSLENAESLRMIPKSQLPIYSIAGSARMYAQDVTVTTRAFYPDGDLIPRYMGADNRSGTIQRERAHPQSRALQEPGELAEAVSTDIPYAPRCSPVSPPQEHPTGQIIYGSSLPDGYIEYPVRPSEATVSNAPYYVPVESAQPRETIPNTVYYDSAPRELTGASVYVPRYAQPTSQLVTRQPPLQLQETTAQSPSAADPTGYYTEDSYQGYQPDNNNSGAVLQRQDQVFYAAQDYQRGPLPSPFPSFPPRFQGHSQSHSTIAPVRSPSSAGTQLQSPRYSSRHMPLAIPPDNRRRSSPQAYSHVSWIDNRGRPRTYSQESMGFNVHNYDPDSLRSGTSSAATSYIDPGRSDFGYPGLGRPRVMPVGLSPAEEAAIVYLPEFLEPEQVDADASAEAPDDVAAYEVC